MSDALFQNFSTVQSKQQLGPTTIASTTTIAPPSYLTYITGTIDIATITPPVTGICQIALIFTDSSPGNILTTGNVPLGYTTINDNSVITLLYNPWTATWAVQAVA